MCRNSIRMLYLGTRLWYFIASPIASHSYAFGNAMELLLQRKLKRIEVGQAGDYAGRAGDYVACAGDYLACAGDNTARAGDYSGRAGVYVACAGDYGARAGDYVRCAGVYVRCAGDCGGRAGDFAGCAGVYMGLSIKLWGLFNKLCQRLKLVSVLKIQPQTGSYL